MRYRSMLSAIGILAISATALAAQAKVPDAWATGQIERVDAATKSVVIKQGTHEMTFVLASDAHLMQGKKALQTADLASEVGHQARVRYTTKGGTKIAERIEVSEATPSAMATPGAKSTAKAPVKPPVKR